MYLLLSSKKKVYSREDKNNKWKSLPEAHQPLKVKREEMSAKETLKEQPVKSEQNLESVLKAWKEGISKETTLNAAERLSNTRSAEWPLN